VFFGVETNLYRANFIIIIIIFFKYPLSVWSFILFYLLFIVYLFYPLQKPNKKETK